MPELGSYGSVRGARGNSRPYREPRPKCDIDCLGFLQCNSTLNPIPPVPNPCCNRDAVGMVPSLDVADWH